LVDQITNDIGAALVKARKKKHTKLYTGNLRRKRSLPKPRCREREDAEMKLKGKGCDEIVTVHSEQIMFHWFFSAVNRPSEPPLWSSGESSWL
jgi:hypothetical protein